MKSNKAGTAYLVIFALISIFTPGQVRIYFGMLASLVLYSIIYFIAGIQRPISLVRALLLVFAYFSMPVFWFIDNREEWYPYVMPVFMIIGLLGFVGGYFFSKRKWEFAISSYLLALTICIVSYYNLGYIFYVTGRYWEPGKYSNITGRPFRERSFLDICNDFHQSQLDTNIGKKVLVFDFMFVGCPPCMAKLPSFDSLGKIFKRDNVLFFLVITGKINSKAEAEDFSRRFHGSYIMLYDSSGVFDTEYNIGRDGYPAEIKVDKTGKIREITSGYADEQNRQFNEAYIQNSMQEIKEYLRE